MKRILLLAILAVLLLSTSVMAPAYMKLGDIKGEATEENHKEWIVVDGYAFELHSEEGATARVPRTVEAGDFVVEKTVDKATPKLAEAVAKGRLFPTAEIEFVREGPEGSETYLRYELKNVLVTSYQVGGSSDQVPTEQISLNFEKIKNTHTEYDDAGRKISDIVWEWVLSAFGAR
jgi:type VI secretion system secreted protein Hcp